MSLFQNDITSSVLNKETASDSLLFYAKGMTRLVDVVQELSLARNLNTIMQIVRIAARELTGADGATFVLKDGSYCYYAEENAIAPLWKGQRFPIELCISGWVMTHAQHTIIPDISLDSRVPQDAYRPTFVKSLLMVPIRDHNPIGAIGNYWAKPRVPTDEEIGLLQALANTTAVAMENVQLYNELEQRVKDRTAQLEAVNKELETFSYSVSHDLRAPLRSILGFSNILLETAQEKLNEQEQEYFGYICKSGHRMEELINNLLDLSRLNKRETSYEEVNLSLLAQEIIETLKMQEPERAIEVKIQPDILTQGDPHFLKIALENLLGNAWKYTSKTKNAELEFGLNIDDNNKSIFYVRDNGAGFCIKYADKLFGVFQRLHTNDEFPGNGVGLAIVARIVGRHNGHIWAESEVDQGSTFFFTLA